MESKFIILEGVDTTGKSTLGRFLERKIDNSIYHKTPKNVSQDELKKMDLENISTQDRYNFYVNALLGDKNEIENILDQGKNVICDRYIYSTMVCHKSIDSGINLHSLEKFNLNNALKVLLLSTKEEILSRLSKRDSITRFEKNTKLLLDMQSEFQKQKFDLQIDTTKNDIEQSIEKVLELIY